MMLNTNIQTKDNLLTINNNANFDVVKRPIYYKAYDDSPDEDIQEIPNRYALIRTDKEQSLGVVSSRYKLRKYKDLVEKVNESIMESINSNHISNNVTINDWVSDNGAKFKRDVYFWDQGIPVKDNYKEKAIPHLRIYASYDSTWAEQIIFGSVYVICMNGLVRPEWQFKVYNRHNTNKDTEYTVSMFKQGLEAQKELGVDLFKQIQRKVSHAEVEHLFKNTLAKITQVFDTNNYSDNAMRELCDLWNKYRNSYGDNLFAVYQTATHWSSHPITRGSIQLVQRRREQKVIDMMNSNYWLAMAA